MYYNAQTVSVSDHYPFGMGIKEREWKDSTFSYRFGFNGMEEDNSIKGEGNSLDFGARIYDSRLGRWMSVDPLFRKFPSHSAYNFATNSPIFLVDPDGRDVEPFYEVKHLRVFGYSLFSWKSYKNNFNSTTGEQFEETVLRMADNDKTLLFSEVIFRMVQSDDTYKVQAVPIASGPVANMKKRNMEDIGGYFERGHKGTKDDPHPITLNQNDGYHDNAAVIFEEFFHAAQHDYYTENGQSKSEINWEVEAKVAKAIGGFTSKEEGLTYESDFADKNSTLIDKIRNGQGLSMSEYGQFLGAVNEFAKTVAAGYNLDMEDFDVYGLDYLNSLIEIQKPIVIKRSGSSVPEKTETSE